MSVYLDMNWQVRSCSKTWWDSGLVIHKHLQHMKKIIIHDPWSISLSWFFDITIIIMKIILLLIISISMSRTSNGTATQRRPKRIWRTHSPPSTSETPSTNKPICWLPLPMYLKMLSLGVTVYSKIDAFLKKKSPNGLDPRLFLEISLRFFRKYTITCVNLQWNFLDWRWPPPSPLFGHFSKIYDQNTNKYAM